MQGVHRIGVRRRPIAIMGRIALWLATLAVLGFACRRALLDPLAAPDPTRANAALNAGQDFRDATYYPIKDLLAGGNPYDPLPMLAHWPVRQEFDLYAPLHLVLHLPYAFLPYHPALALYSCFGLAYLIAIGLVSARAVRLPGGWVAAWLTGAAVVLAQFGKSAVYFGQINTLVGLGAVLALTQVGRSGGSGDGGTGDGGSSDGGTGDGGTGDANGGTGDGGAGRSWVRLPPELLGAAGLALAWTKPQFGIPLTVLILARGAWRQALLGTGAAFTVSLPVVAVLVARSGGVGGFLDVVRRNLDYATSTGYAAVDSTSGARVDVSAVLFRVTGWLPPGMELVTLAVVLGLTGWLVGGAARRRRPFDLAELVAVAVGCLVCIAHQQSESLLTVPALAGVLAALVRRRPVPAPLLAATALLWVPVLHVAAVEHLLIDHAGAHLDSLVEGLSLNASFVIVCGWLLLGRRHPDPAREVSEAFAR